MKSDRGDWCREFLGLKRVSFDEWKYLGLPFVHHSRNSSHFDFLIDKTWNRLRGWKEKLISSAGREILIKAVLQSLPVYAMSVYKLPIATISQLTSLLRNYWWTGDDRKGMCWKNWDSMCSSKRDGGMGFRNLKAFNEALLAKQLWRILHAPNLLISKGVQREIFQQRF